MAEKQYSNREVDRMFKEISDTLQRIEAQTIKTNGRVSKHDRWFLVCGIVGGMLVVQNFPEIIKFVALFI